MDRRRFLAATVATGGMLLAGCAPSPGPIYPPQSGELFEGQGPFPSGIGSADPLPDAVLLWTRVHPERDPGNGVAVAVDVASNPLFRPGDIVGTFGGIAAAARDHCLTIDATGLAPSTTYWYRFRFDGESSPVGRTRTAPAPGSDPNRTRLAVFSCQRWTHGWFNAHADLAAMADDDNTDIDLVVCLGDYVYNTGYADDVYVPGRDDPVQDAITHQQFRSKYRLYRSDPALQAVHALYPMVNVFDNHDGLSEPGDAQAAGAIAAFWEHLPVRAPSPGRIHRSVRWGDAFELFMTDQRQYRDPQLLEAGLLGTSTAERPEILDPSRTMLGAEQRQWLLDGLVSSTAQWKVIGSQLMFWPWRTFGRLPWEPRGSGVYLNLTQWDGYAAERLALLDHLAAHDVRDTLLFSGDSHVFSAAQVAPDVDDPRSEPRIVEFSTGSVTSNNADESNFPTDDVTGPIFKSVNSNTLRYFESERHGYVIAELTPQSATVEMRSPTSIRRDLAPSQTLTRLRVERGTQRIRTAPPPA